MLIGSVQAQTVRIVKVICETGLTIKQFIKVNGKKYIKIKINIF